MYYLVIIVLIIAIPTLVMPKKFTLLFGKFLANSIILILRITLNTKVIFHGLENLKKVDKFFVASAHQSMLETFILQAPLNFPIFILKKELLNIPLFGWYLRKIGSIEIVRETTTKDNLSFLERIKKVVPMNWPRVIISDVTVKLAASKKVVVRKSPPIALISKTMDWALKIVLRFILISF